MSEPATTTETPGAEAAGTPAPEGASERPEWLPEKFDTPEDMAKAYGELETKLGQQSKPEGAPYGEETTDTSEAADGESQEADAGQEEQTEADAPDALPEQFRPFADEFEASGELTEDSYAKLAEMGFPKAMVDQYVEGAKARQATLGDISGMVEWAGSEAGMSDTDIAAYNALVADPKTQDQGIAFLRERYEAANGTSPTRVSPGSNGTAQAGPKPYASRSEWRADRQNPDYERGGAFTRMVDARLALSNFN